MLTSNSKRFSLAYMLFVKQDSTGKMRYDSCFLREVNSYISCPHSQFWRKSIAKKIQVQKLTENWAQAPSD